MTISLNCVKIDLSALEHNLNQARGLIDSDTLIMGIVKSDAYGHGIVQVSKLLEKNRVHCLGVSYPHEALDLRDNGIKIPIVILCGIRTEKDAETVVKKNLTPVVYDLISAEMLNKVALKNRKKVNIFVKIDTGMGRIGIPVSRTEAFIKVVMEHESLFIQGMLSHLSSADESVHNFTRKQVEIFRQAIDIGRKVGLELPMNSLANSAGIIEHKETHFDMVRPGIMLYGGLPSPGFKTSVNLKPVMKLTGRVLQVNNLPDRTPVSYARSYYTKGNQKIAVASIGYGDGLPRNLSNRGKVLIGGQKANIAGRICMNMATCNITGRTDVHPGDEVVVLGSQGECCITGDDIAEKAETISYEIFCSIGQRVKKKYIT